MSGAKAIVYTHHAFPLFRLFPDECGVSATRGVVPEPGMGRGPGGSEDFYLF
jgi:hypothetical protein